MIIFFAKKGGSIEKKIKYTAVLYKCGPNKSCHVKHVVSEVKDPNLIIHFLKNCLHCDGINNPRYDEIS